MPQAEEWFTVHINGRAAVPLYQNAVKLTRTFLRHDDIFQRIHFLRPDPVRGEFTFKEYSLVCFALFCLVKRIVQYFVKE